MCRHNRSLFPNSNKILPKRRLQHKPFNAGLLQPANKPVSSKYRQRGPDKKPPKINDWIDDNKKI